MFNSITDARTWWENSGYFPMERFDDFDESALIEDLYRNADTDSDLDAICEEHLDPDGERH